MIEYLDDLLRDGRSGAAALQSGTTTLSRSELRSRVAGLVAELERVDARRVAIYADNGIGWVVADLACQVAGLPVTPLPLFFSQQQIQHALGTSGVDTIVADRDLSALIPGARSLATEMLSPAQNVFLHRVEHCGAANLPEGTQKITFTSGTTIVCPTLSGASRLSLFACAISLGLRLNLAAIEANESPFITLYLFPWTRRTCGILSSLPTFKGEPLRSLFSSIKSRWETP